MGSVGLMEDVMF